MTIPTGSTRAISPRGTERLMMVLLFLIAMIAYSDRQIIALLKPVLDQIFGWTAADYGMISSWSQAAIAVSLLASGWVVDRLGVRVTLGAGVAGWSLMTVFHAFVRSVNGFLAVRVGLGVFEGIGTPASMKAVSANFSAGQRGRVIGILNAAPNIAAMGTPLMVAALYPLLGWQGTIIVVGLLGLGCAIPWLLLRQRTTLRESVSEALPLRAPARISNRRMVAAFAAAKFITDPVWWFLLFWLPDILHHRFGLDPVHLGVPLAVAYLMAAVGSLLGGYLPPVMASRVGGPERARRIVMGVAALCVLPIPFVLHTHVLGIAVVLCGLTLGAHQAFASNLFGFATEWFPHDRVGRGTGIGAFCGNIGGALGLHLVGRVAGTEGGLVPVLGYCAVAYCLAWVMLRLVVPHDRFDGRAGAPIVLNIPVRTA